MSGKKPCWTKSWSGPCVGRRDPRCHILAHQGPERGQKHRRDHQEYAHLHRQPRATQSRQEGRQSARHKPQGDQRNRGSFQDAEQQQEPKPNCNFHVHIFLSSYLTNSLADLQ